MPNLTISGYTFDVPDDPSIAVGTPMEAGHVASLQQTRRENIRNNFAQRMKRLQGEAETLTEEQLAQLRDELSKYASEYRFGERVSTGRAARVVDPIEREMRDIAKADLVAAYIKHIGSKPPADYVNENVPKLLESKNAEYRRRAERAVRDRNAAAEAVLAGLGVAA